MYGNTKNLQLLKTRQRNKVIYLIFSMISCKYRYAILHHLECIFNNKTDIDLVIGCNKKEFISLMKTISNELNLKIVSYFTIDTNIYRLDFIYKFDSISYDIIELDCLLLGNKENLYRYDTKYYLENIKTQKHQEYNICIVEARKEYEYYIKKKAYKNICIDIYYDYLLKIQPNKTKENINELYNTWNAYYKCRKFKLIYYMNKFQLIFMRYFDNPAMSIAILGPDGSGKSTIIDKLFDQNIFRKKYYFHLKPVKTIDTIYTYPHKKISYGYLMSYIKLIYFIFQYSYGWLKNIIPLGFKSSLIVFDRYYDDILADPIRYRYNGRLSVARFLRLFIPKPDVYFILITEAKIIHDRKKEVSFKELERQLNEYKKLVDNKVYFYLDANKIPSEIVNEIVKIISNKMHERY